MGTIITTEQLSITVEKIKQSNQKIILIGGCFDIIHAGHIDFLKAVKNLKGKVILLLESDETVKKLKGKGRPVTSHDDRAKILSHFSSVDVVVKLPPLASNEVYIKVVKSIKPDIIAITENDPLRVVKEKQAKMVDGTVEIVIHRVNDYSTQQIIERIKNL